MRECLPEHSIAPTSAPFAEFRAAVATHFLPVAPALGLLAPAEEVLYPDIYVRFETAAGATLCVAYAPRIYITVPGTPRLITGNGGAVIAKRSYGAFGRGLNVASTPAPAEAAQFTGHERDSFQLDYMHARSERHSASPISSMSTAWR
jgi:hypothetical protein